MTSEQLESLRALIAAGIAEVDWSARNRAALLETNRRYHESYGYLSRLLGMIAPAVEQLDTLPGLCTQIDNVIGGLRDKAEMWQEALPLLIGAIDNGCLVGVNQECCGQGVPQHGGYPLEQECCGQPTDLDLRARQLTGHEPPVPASGLTPHEEHRLRSEEAFVAGTEAMRTAAADLVNNSRYEDCPGNDLRSIRDRIRYMPLPAVATSADAELAAIAKRMVDRFLSWRLPDDFNPDGGISYTRPNLPPSWAPAGTNLFTATQAEAMVRHMLTGGKP